jgi:signal transduction histidine kinase/CheY-like chemotaxis protein
MTRRMLQFASTALVGTVLVAAALAISYGRLTLTNLAELGAEQNRALALSISNAAHIQLDQLLAESTRMTVAELQAHARTSELHTLLQSQIRDLSVVRVNVFDTRGILVYSTDTTRIGEDGSSNPGYVSALAGEAISDIVRRDTMNTFDQIVENRDLIQTYLPFRSVDGATVGVFEVYSDVTRLLARISGSQNAIVAGVTLALGLFYVLLVWQYRRTEKQLQVEQATTQSYLEEIETANATLEERVEERTRALDVSRNFLQTAIDGVPDPAFVIDTDYRVTSMNEAARSMFGAGDGEPVVCYRALHGRSTPCDDPDHTCTLLNGAACRKVERRVDEAGDWQRVEIRTTPLRDAAGEITGAIEIMHDLDEREQIAYKLQQAKERAEAASQVKSEFVATMSHEIRTPMNAVLGMTDLLRLTELTQKQQGYIEVIQSSGNMLLSLVDNILDFSRLGAGALELQYREFDVMELLERVLEITGYPAYAKGLELVACVDAKRHVRCLGDEDRLRQILINLVGNAIKFSETGEIMVSAGVRSTRVADSLEFSVADRGIGMTAEVQQQLFAPFTVVDELSAGNQQGSGLGLAICKRLVEHMGGEIGVESGPSEGTRVWFRIPLEAGATRSAASSIPALQSRRILMVCQNRCVADVLSDYVSAWGMSCDHVESADDTLARLQGETGSARTYDVAIIDNAALGVDGLRLARAIRSSKATAALPIVLLTPISESLRPGEITSIGNVLCVNKPVLPSELQLAIFNLVDSDGDPLERISVEAGQDLAVDRLRILVAEDNLVNRRVLTGMLGSLNCAAECVENGPAVLTALEEEPYDIVLMDCQMPGMDGEQVTAHIRKDRERFPSQPVIVAITADASLEHRSACLAAGMDDFIAKPLRLAKLREGLGRWQELVDTRADVDDDVDVADAHAREQLRDRAAAQGATFLTSYIDLFLQDTASRLDSLNTAFEKHDLAALKRESHAVKGACLEFGVVRMGRYCDELRECAKHEKFDQIRYVLGSLNREFERIRPVLEAEKVEQAASLSRDR